MCASGRQMEKWGGKQDSTQRERKTALHINSKTHKWSQRGRDSPSWGWIQPPKFSSRFGEFANCERKISISIPLRDIHYKRLKPTITSHFITLSFILPCSVSLISAWKRGGVWKSRAGREMFRRTSGTLLKGEAVLLTHITISADDQTQIGWKISSQGNHCGNESLKWTVSMSLWHWELWDERDLLNDNVNRPFGFKGIVHPKMKILLLTLTSFQTLFCGTQKEMFEEDWGPTHTGHQLTFNVWMKKHRKFIKKNSKDWNRIHDRIHIFGWTFHLRGLCDLQQQSS